MELHLLIVITFLNIHSFNLILLINEDKDAFDYDPTHDGPLLVKGRGRVMET